MWVRLVVSVTLLPMLVHSILGCCWHHAHSEINPACEQSVADLHDGHRHTHDPCTDDNHRNHPVGPAPSEHEESCEDLRCVYLAAEPVRNVLAKDLRWSVAGSDARWILTLNATATRLRPPQFGHEVSASSHHRALTQVWVV